MNGLHLTVELYVFIKLSIFYKAKGMKFFFSFLIQKKLCFDCLCAPDTTNSHQCHGEVEKISPCVGKEFLGPVPGSATLSHNFYKLQHGDNNNLPLRVSLGYKRGCEDTL